MKNKINVQLVVYEEGWILEAIAKQWVRLLEKKLDPECFTTSLKKYEPENSADVVVHFNYLTAVFLKDARNIAYVTHIDRWWKALKLIRLARHGMYFITMSTETLKLVNRYVGSARAVSVIPESIHFGSQQSPKRALTFGLFFRHYDDGRKSPDLIERLCEFANENPMTCKLEIAGNGFAKILSNYQEINVSYYEGSFDSQIYEHMLRNCDYIVYFGRDEGAISILDAATLGIPVLAVDQGYHKDIALAPGSMLFDCADQILGTIMTLCLSMRGNDSCVGPVDAIRALAVASEYKSPSFFRYFVAPFIKNRFLLRKDNILHTLIYCYRLVVPGRRE